MESHDDDMEAVGGGGGGGGGGSVGIPANSRWNPTKEQISMLETLYSQGIRTPTTKQIQQITRSLKAYGPIEGKNVFYWFQNHKARQRQKQKQENMASYINTYLHNAHQRPAVVFAPPPRPNVACSPFYPPQRDFESYQKHPKVLFPGSYKRRARTGTTMDRTRRHAFMGYEAAAPVDYNYKNLANFNTKNNNNNNNNNQETLPLFPLHPTGILRGGATSSTEDSVDTGIEERRRSSDKPYFDFFIGQDPYDSRFNVN